MFFIWGAINSGAVFFVPVLTTFGWTRAKLSVALSIGWVTGGATGPLIGWIADRVDPKKMMVTGATIPGLLFLALSRATTFGEFLLINGMFGICVGASTSIPISLLIANWFEHRRGLAMGIAFSGSTLGGAVMTIVASHAIAARGWRVGYLTLALPILLIVVPLIVFFVRNRNAGEARESADASSAGPDVQLDSSSYQLPGLELSQATKTRSFWLICAAQFFAGSSLGLGPHFIAYLIGVGYSATFAATVVSLYLLMTTAGTLLGGPLADRFTARFALTCTYALASFGTIALLAASHPLALATTVLGAGFAWGALAVQTPLVMIESLGVRRLGSVLGVTGIFYTIGAAVSPIITGRIFDVTGSYSIAITSFVVFLGICAFAISRCRPLSLEQIQFEPSAPSRAA
jgi:MFS family permease